MTLTSLSTWTATIVGTTGDKTVWPCWQSHSCQIGGHWMTCEFPFLPECLMPPLGRDLLMCPNNHYSQRNRKPHLWQQGTLRLWLWLSLSRDEEWLLYSPGKIDPTHLLQWFPTIWAEKGPMGLARNHAPIMVDLKSVLFLYDRDNIQCPEKYTWEFGTAFIDCWI